VNTAPIVQQHGFAPNRQGPSRQLPLCPKREADVIELSDTEEGVRPTTAYTVVDLCEEHNVQELREMTTGLNLELTVNLAMYAQTYDNEPLKFTDPLQEDDGVSITGRAPFRQDSRAHRRRRCGDCKLHKTFPR